MCSSRMRVRDDKNVKARPPLSSPPMLCDTRGFRPSFPVSQTLYLRPALKDNEIETILFFFLLWPPETSTLLVSKGMSTHGPSEEEPFLMRHLSPRKVLRIALGCHCRYQRRPEQSPPTCSVSTWEMFLCFRSVLICTFFLFFGQFLWEGFPISPLRLVRDVDDGFPLPCYG